MSDRDIQNMRGSSRSRDRDRNKSRDLSEERVSRKHKHKYKHDRERSGSGEKDRKIRRPDKEVVHSKSKGDGSPLRGSKEVREFHEDTKVREMSISPQREEQEDNEDVPTPPPPPRISKISIGFGKPTSASSIKMNLSGLKAQPLQKKPSIASVFNTSDDDEPEEMPAEARMRMRNIGRETPTSVGPNSFGKTKQGFCNSKKIFEKNLNEAMDSVNSQKSATKLPTTIYKL